MRASRVLLPVLAMAALVSLPLAAQGQTSNTLDIYLIDVEGGNATLFVSPTGESLLIDTGYPSEGRDSGRIIAAAQDAGLTRIDHLITTHYHRDHIGGLAELNGAVSRRPLHRSWTQPGSRGLRRWVRGGLQGHLRTGEAHGGASRRHDSDGRS